MDFIKIIYRKFDHNSCCLTTTQNKIYCNNSRDNIIKIKFGSLSTSLKKILIYANETDSNILYLSEDLKSLINIPDNSLLQIRKIEQNYIEIGPLVGVFISSKKAAKLSEGRTDSVYEQISLAMSKLKGICCFFSAGDIDWERKFVKGLVKDGSKWTAHILPLPTVIYDRCFGSSGRNHSVELRKRLGSEYHVINSIPKLAKWETICALRKNPGLLESIPQTRIYNSYKDLETALLTCDSVYLKPDALYKGKGIYRVSKESNGRFKIESRTETQNIIKFLSNLNSIDEIISHYSVLGKGYLIQKEIKKAYYGEYPFDFRLLYQKDFQGTWQPSGIAVRMGAPGSIITSPRSGGAVAEFSKVLKDTFGEDTTTKNGLYENVLSIGKEIVTTLEKEFGDCVELGLDMTIDINKKIWVIEVNGKPLKVSLKRLNDHVLIARCYSRPIEYAVFLTGFKSADTEVREY